MGKIGLALNLIARTAKFVKTCGKESVLMTKPQNISRIDIEALRFAPHIKKDVCTFTKDPTLAPELLDDMLKIKGSQSEKAMQIKDRFLRAMGYRHPELVKEGACGNGDLGIDILDGTLGVTSGVEIPLTKLIPAVRHEMDHLDKMAKLVKVEGVEIVEAALQKGLNSKKLRTFKKFDREFWLKMSEDADITNFDSKKYLKALDNYRYDLTAGQLHSFWQTFNLNELYCANELEKSAYAIQQKILKYYGEDPSLPVDIFGSGKPFEKVRNLMTELVSKREIYEPKGFKGAATFDQLYITGVAKSEPEGIKCLKYLRDYATGKIPKDNEKIANAIQRLNEIDFRCRQDKNKFIKILDDIYNNLKEEKFSIDELV